ncbi:MAG: MBL fold metallo-hydrolase [Peptostreptococcaceae bacterium]
MKITYIHHSSFSIELDNCILLFDYFKGDLPKWNRNKSIYVFSSHGHHDHFSPVIFNLEKEYTNVTYVLSDDIKVKKSANIYFVKPNDTLYIDDLEIKTLESTDLGVAFIIQAESKLFYHAGDLNYWHWEGELTAEENYSFGVRYKKELSKISDLGFDISFVPLDPRQQDQYSLGFDTFMKNINTRYIFPMHFWMDYSIIDKILLDKCSKSYRNKIIKITKESEEFILE